MQSKQANPVTGNDLNRRQFISTAGKAAGAALLMTSPLLSFATDGKVNADAKTVGDIMDLFISEVPGAPFANTVDTLKAGDRTIVVTGIVTTMFATLEVTHKAIALGANFIIAHEPTFYNHLDATAWLENDNVYRYKRDLLKQHNIAVWRNHDYIHRHVPDGVENGVIARLGWGKYYDASHNVAAIPAVTLRSLVQHTKERLGIPTLRYIGDLSQSCKKILLMPGASGGKSHIEGIMREQPDVLICGEIQEWETAEYVRDAQTKGDKLSLVVLGHIASEEPGSAYMATWLKEKVPGIIVTHVPAKNSLSFL
ncbi:MAG: Nif3-like dinuclear metal center hexameric protein [Ferruginibacter sp.]